MQGYAQQEVAVEVLSEQLAKKRGVPRQQAMAPAADMGGGGPGGGGGGGRGEYRPGRPNTDSMWSYNALPNEWIVPLGKSGIEPVLGGSFSKLTNKGVIRFPSSVQRIEFSTDNISSENQGVLVEGWACWRVSNPKKAIEVLDFSDPNAPMLNTSKILAIEAAGIMKGLISVKTVQDLLKRREDVIERLSEKLKPTESRWGISFDEIGISEVQILSQDVFENLQRPFRNEAREVAATSDLDTEERIASKRASQKERVASLTAENERKLRELETRNQTSTHELEMAEEKKRLLQEQEVKGMRIEEEKRVQRLQAEAERELERQRVEAEHAAALSALDAQKQKRLAELRSESERTAEAARLDAERRAAELEAAAQLREKEERLELERLALAREVEDARRILEEARKTAELQIARLDREGEIDALRAKLTFQQERERFRLEVAAEDRRILGQLSEAEIRAKLVEALPSIAGNIKVGDVRWYGGGSGGDVGPVGIIGRALDQVLDIAESHGITVGRKNGNGGPAAPAAPAAASADEAS